MVLAWLFNSESWEESQDMREEHKTEPVKIVTLSFLSSLGLQYWHIDADRYESDNAYGDKPLLDQLAEQNGWIKRDQISLSKDVPGYMEIMKHGFAEHLHEDPEVRYVLNGSGYYDVRSNKADEWIRIHFQRGDLVVIPRGCFHRFTLDTNEFIEVVRLFTDKPKWKPHPNNPETSTMRVRRKYQATYNGKQNFNGSSYLNSNQAARDSLYPAMRQANGQVHISGVGPYRQDTDKFLAGVKYKTNPSTKQKTLYQDIRVQTRACLENMKLLLNQVGAGLEHLVTLTIYVKEGGNINELNEMYARYFDAITGPCRTLVFVARLRQKLALVEMQGIAALPDSASG